MINSNFMLKGLMSVLFASLFSMSAFAAFVGPGATSIQTITAKEALELADDSKVALQGSLVKQTAEEHYLFKDQSGVVMVEIEDEDFRHITVTPEDKIRIIGEVDKEWTESKVDVEHIEIIK